MAESASAMVLTSDASKVLDLDVRRGSLHRLTGRTVAVSDDVAASLGAEVGGRVRLVLGDGTRIAAEVVAVYARGLGFGPVVLSHDLATGHTTAALDQSILVRTDGTVRARQGLDAFASARPGFVLQEADPRPADGLKGSPPEVRINLAVVVLLTYLILNIANKLVAATVQRRTEMAALRLNGTTPAQIRAMVRREAAFTIVTALTTGLLLSAVPLALVGQGFLGRPWPAGPIWLLPSLAVAVTVTAVLAVELPARRALHTPPAEAAERSRPTVPGHPFELAFHGVGRAAGWTRAECAGIIGRTPREPQ
ncbi:ABC transporter permease [Streptomyces sp. NPDC020196]|uniref:ABC transporter permease n=1 Tax=Streptomyces sp. NPDC020196 TaxID=3156656 RepID=UPI0033FCD311